MEVADIHTKDFFLKYRLKTLKLVDLEESDLTVAVSIDGYGKPVDEKMDYWEDAENSNDIMWCYDDRCFSNKVAIFVISSSYERPLKRQKRYKL